MAKQLSPLPKRMDVILPWSAACMPPLGDCPSVPTVCCSVRRPSKLLCVHVPMPHRLFSDVFFLAIQATAVVAAFAVHFLLSYRQIRCGRARSLCLCFCRCLYMYISLSLLVSPHAPSSLLLLFGIVFICIRSLVSFLNLLTFDGPSLHWLILSTKQRRQSGFKTGRSWVRVWKRGGDFTTFESDLISNSHLKFPVHYKI